MEYVRTIESKIDLSKCTSLASMTRPFIKRQHSRLVKPSLKANKELSWESSLKVCSFSSFSKVSWGGDLTFGLQEKCMDRLQEGKHNGFETIYINSSGQARTIPITLINASEVINIKKRHLPAKCIELFFQTCNDFKVNFLSKKK